MPTVKAETAKNTAQQAADPGQVKRMKHRSPNYPFINLQKAIERTKDIFDKDKLHEIPVSVACTHWDYKAGGSQSDQTIAALKAFGLLDVSGTGDKRTVKISDRAYRVLAGAQDKADRIKEAALLPHIHAELWQKYKDQGLPSDAVMRHYLQFDREGGTYNQDVVDGVIERFNETISFANLRIDDKIFNESGRPQQEDCDGLNEPKIGDFIQWESQGVAQFTEPQKVVWKSEDGDFLFVYGAPSGIPIEQAQRVDPPDGKGAAPMTMAATNQNSPSQDIRKVPPANPMFNPDHKFHSPETKQYTYTVDTGDAVVRWPAVLSDEDCKGIEAWLESLKAKIKRSVKADNATEKPKSNYVGQG